MVKIRYNKEKPGRILMGRGPRDIQLKQKVLREQETYKHLTPIISVESANGVMQTEVDSSQYLSLDEVRKKIEEAVDVVREEERKRYESGLKNLNDQLNQMRKKAAAAEEQLINANAEINRLNNILTGQKGVSEKEIEKFKNTIDSLKIQLEEKDKQLREKTDELVQTKQIVSDLQSEVNAVKNELHTRDLKITELQTLLNNNQSVEIVDKLQEKLDRLYEKIADGSISPLVGSKIPKPELEDRIFIDPLDDTIRKKEADLDTHIDVKEERKEIRRSVEEDISKLRKLLKL